MPAAEPGNVQRPRRFSVHDVKRTFTKPINISSQVLLDRERCILCARCTRFSDQIAGDPFIEMLERGALQQVGIYANEPFDSYFSGNTVQICPVGALTGTAYRFRARPFDLVSSPSVCEHCASGCAQRTDHRRGKVLRRLAGDDPEVNEEWNCDKGRWAFNYATQGDRITTPLIRDADGSLAPASWSHAVAAAIEGLDHGARRYRRAGRRPADLRRRLRLRQVRPNRVGHQRHRLPRPPALGRGGAVPGGSGRGQADHGQLLRSGVGAGGAARRLRAGRRVADRVPAAAQSRPQARAAGVRGRAVRQPRAAEDARHADRDRARRRGRRAGRAGRRRTRRAAVQARRGHPRRRTAGRRARRLVGRGPARRRHRRPAGLGAAPRRRARRAGGRRAAGAAARRPSARRRRPPARRSASGWHVSELPSAAGP